jgi:hypothetical protein
VGVPRHPQIVIGPRNQIAVVWDEQSRGIRQVAVGRGTVQRDGRVQFAREVIDSGTPGVYPAATISGDRLLVAWTSGSGGQTVVRSERLEF